MADPQTAPHAPDVEKSHPAGLYVLFFSEMWERFCYYGMRALLVLYMVNFFRWTPGSASKIYKWYTALVYLTPLAGGYLADRHLGNKRAVVLGGVMMAAGEFCLVFDSVPLFYAGLILLIIGCGLFKPNCSTQVGRLYPPNDPRRDAAYTIFYMGINLGAFLSPIVCGYLRENYGYRYGFAAAGVGMLLGVATYLLGMPLVKEVSGATTADAKSDQPSSDGGAPESDDAPSAVPTLNRTAPLFVALLGVLCIPLGLALYAAGKLAFDNMLTVLITAGVLFACAWVLKQLRGAARDRVMAIYGIGVFVIFFWAAFEQAGNAMNLWADQVTNRFITVAAPPPPILPEVAAPVGFPELAAAAVAEGSPWQFGPAPIALLALAALALALAVAKIVRRTRWTALMWTLVGGTLTFAPIAALAIANPAWWHHLWNPVSTEWFQSVNAIAIVVLAPLFAWFWIRWGQGINIPTKMVMGIGFMALAFLLMVFSARVENKPTSTPLAALPATFRVAPDRSLRYHDAPDYNDKLDLAPGDEEVPAQGGRLYYDGATLSMEGVLADVDRDRILRSTVPSSFVKKAMELMQKSRAQAGERFTVEVVLDEIPPGLDLRQAGFHEKNISFDPVTRTLRATNLKLDNKDYKSLLLVAAEPRFRDALNALFMSSAKHKVSGWWLVWFYIFSTMGELCLSPVGLSMASKLAPPHFGTLLMGIWFLTFFYGNFTAGAAGESWGTVSPTTYFLALVLALGAAAAALAGVARLINRMMHGVR